MDDEFKKNKESLSKFEEGFTKFAAVAGAALVAIGGLAINTGIDYESAFAGVRKTVDATEEQFEMLSNGIRSMAKEIPVSASNIAGLAEAAGQLGIKTENILGFTRVIADLGVATNIVGQEGASQIARFANIVGMSQTDFDKFGSSIVALGNNFATTEAEILNMSMRLAGAGSQVGMSESDILGLATALSSVGIEAEMGGSAISKVLVNMSAAGATADKVAELLKVANKESGGYVTNIHELQMWLDQPQATLALAESMNMTKSEVAALVKSGSNLESFSKIAGMTGEEFKKAFADDAVGALQAFIGGLANAEDAGSSAIELLQEMGITEVRLRDSLLRAAGAGDLLTDAVKLSNEAWEENTALTNEAEQRYGTTASKLQRLKNIATDAGISFFDMIAPAVISAVENLSVAIDWLSRNLDIVLPIVATLTVAFGGLALVMNMQKMITGVTLAFKAFNLVVAANPIGIIITVIAALVTGLIVLWNTNEDFRNAVITAWNAIKDTAVTVWSAIVKFFTEDIPAAFDAFVSKLIEIRDAVVGFVLGIVDYFNTLPIRIKEAIAGVLAAIVDWATSMAETVATEVPKIIDAINTWFEELPYKIGYAIGFAIGKVIAWAADLIETAKAEVPKIIESIVAYWLELPGKMWSAIISAKDKIIEWATIIYNEATTRIKKLIDDVITALKELPQKAWESIIGTRDKIIEWATVIYNEAVTRVKQLISDVESNFKALPGKIYDAIKSAVDKVKQWANDLIATAKTELPKFVQSVVDIVSQLPSKMIDIGKNIVEGLWDGIKNATGWLMDKIGGFVDGIIDGIKDGLGIASPSKVMAALGKFTAQGFIVGVESMANAVSNAMDNIFEPDFAPRFPNPSLGGGSLAFAAPTGGQGGGGLVINQYMQTVPQTPYETQTAAVALFNRARW